MPQSTPRPHFLRLACLLLLFSLHLSDFSRAQTSEIRTWTSTAGTSIRAKAIAYQDGKVNLETSEGRVIPVEIKQLSPADQDFLKNLYEMTEAPEKKPETVPSGTFPHPLGKVVGPIEANGSKYHLYLPKSLKPGVKVPLLFFTSSGGGGYGTLKPLIEGAEINGWVIATSVESKNGMEIKLCLQHTANCTQHITETLPVDPKRIYYSGGSGGSRVAFANSKEHKGAGVLAIIAGAQPDEEIRGRHYFFITGATDYNRYGVAYSYDNLKSNSALRIHSGSHSAGPDWLRTEGMVWLETQALQEIDEAPERAHFEAAVLPWLDQMKTKEPERAAWWANHLLASELQSSETTSKLRALAEECAASPESENYAEAIADIEDFAAKTLADGPRYSPDCFKHTSDKIQRKVDDLLEKYPNTPGITPVLNALKNKTGG
ncbi:MAG: SHD1 domain-containing protein [Verrucomicrobiales bacterium]